MSIIHAIVQATDASSPETGTDPRFLAIRERLIIVHALHLGPVLEKCLQRIKYRHFFRLWRNRVTALLRAYRIWKAPDSPFQITRAALSSYQHRVRLFFVPDSFLHASDAETWNSLQRWAENEARRLLPFRTAVLREWQQQLASTVGGRDTRPPAVLAARSSAAVASKAATALSVEESAAVAPSVGTTEQHLPETATAATELQLPPPAEIHPRQQPSQQPLRRFRSERRGKAAGLTGPGGSQEKVGEFMRFLQTFQQQHQARR